MNEEKARAEGRDIESQASRDSVKDDAIVSSADVGVHATEMEETKKTEYHM